MVLHKLIYNFVQIVFELPMIQGKNHGVGTFGPTTMVNRVVFDFFQ